MAGGSPVENRINTIYLPHQFIGRRETGIKVYGRAQHERQCNKRLAWMIGYKIAATPLGSFRGLLLQIGQGLSFFFGKAEMARRDHDKAFVRGRLFLFGASP